MTISNEKKILVEDGLVSEPPCLSLEKTSISFVERGTRHTGSDIALYTTVESRGGGAGCR